jgi:hypothetical protein
MPNAAQRGVTMTTREGALASAAPGALASGNTQGEEWRSPVSLDLDNASAGALASAISAVKDYFTTHPQPALALQSGWHVVTPQLALLLLSRNRGNRRAVLATVQKYLRSMRASKWRRTGQAIVLNSAGDLVEGQHRLWAALFGNVSFTTFIVTDAEDAPDLFAYIDNGKPRSAADALFTSGDNGASRQVASAVSIAMRFDAGLFRVGSLPSMEKPEPWEVIDFSHTNPTLKEAAHKLNANFAKAAKLIGHAGVATFFAWQVMDRYGMNVLATFLTPLATGANLAEDSPIKALRDRLQVGGADQDGRLNQQNRLGLLIKAFAMDYCGEVIPPAPPRRRGVPPQPDGLFLADNEDFPEFPPASAAAGEDRDAA